MAKGKQKEVINHFRARVEMAAQKRGWTLAEVARCVDRSPQALQDTLRRGNPTLATLRQFAEKLEVSTNELMAEVTPLEYGEVMIPKAKK